MSNTTITPTIDAAAAGLVRLQVLRPFSFILSEQRSRKFAAGEHLLDPKNAEDAAILGHPWIARDFADGHIENPAKSKERLADEVAAAEARAHRQAAVLKETQQALGLAP